jgi:AcrR family transcriptional regulator
MPKTEMEPTVRERLEEAMLRELGEKGREGIGVTEILAEAAVSSAEFVDVYGDLDGCLDAAYERMTLRLDAAVRVSCATGGDFLNPGAVDWRTRVRAALETILAELTDRPAEAQALTRAYPALGHSQQARYQAFIERLTWQLRTRREMAGLEDELPDSVDALAVGSAEAIVFDEISSGRTGELAGMGPAILFSVLVPYLGSTEAAVEMERARNPL